MKAPASTPHTMTLETAAKVLTPGDVTIQVASCLGKLDCFLMPERRNSQIRSYPCQIRIVTAPK
jgi:hypothetical protein